MSKVLIVNNTPYLYPVAGDEPGWGANAVDWAEAVTNVLSDLSGPNDILETAFNIANNQITAVDITGLIFNASSVRAAEVSYSAFRLSSTNLSGHAESGKINLVYDNNLGWILNQGNILGSAGITFSILNSGQLQYTSTDIGATNYVGTLKFRGKTLAQ